MKQQWAAIVITIVLLVTKVHHIATLDILAIFPFSGMSHFHMFHVVSRALVARGHNVTVVSHFPRTLQDTPVDQEQNSPQGTFIDYSLAGTVPMFENYTVDDVTGSGYIEQALLILQDGLDNCEGIMSSGRLDELMRSRAVFDLVLVEIFNTGCYVSVANYFGAPVVGITSTSLYPWWASVTGAGDVVMPSYVPVNLLPFTARMTFTERLLNTAMLFTMRTYYKYKYEPEAQRIVDKYLGKLNSTVSQSVNNVNALIVNTHFAFGDTRPLLPGIIEIGGCTYKSPKPLTEDLENYVSSARRGVIYFSMGSIVKGSSISAEHSLAMIKAFSRLEGYHVLWKWEDEPPHPEVRSNNVKFVPWMPQFDVLSHPNVKLFISHGGLNGILEALYSGVPVVGIPMFADQFSNVNYIVYNECGLRLSLDQIDEETVYDTISTVLENDKYTTNIKRLSQLYWDRDLDPIDTAVYWIEYLARHRENLLTKPTIPDQWYEQCLIDVAVMMIVTAATAVYLTIRIFGTCYQTIVGS
ncbi:UDP-glucuronosyl/UDP-glucosyltransferase [Cinara cedri]|uniref:UDP-glucuronosyltransferase n=1 Tax=Cinara cedri TaxID=506608 RepID=A0A5E4NF09_9HEMI|nr:UDP-glucuronosyl/UDP-glucosyltransferase [Cinara cedri]